MTEKIDLKNLDKSTWQKVKFSDIAINVRKTSKNPLKDGFTKAIGLGHIEPDNLNLLGYTDIAKEGTKFNKIFRKGQFLFGSRRAYLRQMARATFDGVCTANIMVFDVKDENLINRDLFEFIIRSDSFINCAINTSEGSLFPNAKWKYIAKYEFLLPPKDQQAQLAKLLWAMDDNIESLIRNNDSIEILKKSQLKEVFSKENCVKLKIGDISDNLDNKRKPISKSLRVSGPTPYYGASGIVDYVEGFTHNEPILLISEDGENLNSRNLPIAYIVNGESWINNHAHVLRITKASRYLVKEYFNFSDISDFITGGTRPKVTKGMLTDMPIFLPKEELLEISERKLKDIDFALDSNISCMESAKSLQKSLINQVF